MWYVYDLERATVISHFCYKAPAVRLADSMNAKRHKRGKRHEAMPQLRLLQIDERRRMEHVMMFAPSCPHCEGTGKNLAAAIKAFHDKRYASNGE